MFTQACAKGLEGIVSKLADSRYVPGRQKFWQKTKCGQRQEFIILGFSDARKRGAGDRSAVSGLPKGQQVSYAGKVGTGFTMKARANWRNDSRSWRSKSRG